MECDLSDLIEPDAEMLSLVGPYVPQFRFVLDDLSRVDDAALRGRSLTALAAVSLMLLGRRRSAANLLDVLVRWVDELGEVAHAPGGIEALSALLAILFASATSCRRSCASWLSGSALPRMRPT